MTETNKNQYLNLLAQHRLAKQCKTEMEHFLTGQSLDISCLSGLNTPHASVLSLSQTFLTLFYKCTDN